MKVSCKLLKIKFLFLLLFTTIGIQAQETWLLGAGPSLELDEELIGANVRAYYGINEHFCFGPEVTIFPFQSVNNEEDIAITDLNFNAHYIFEISHKLGIYPLTGLNYTIETERSSNVTEREEAFAVNYGFGLHYKLGNLYVFSEFKGVTGELKDEFLTVGVIFGLSSKKEKE